MTQKLYTTDYHGQVFSADVIDETETTIVIGWHQAWPTMGIAYTKRLMAGNFVSPNKNKAIELRLKQVRYHIQQLEEKELLLNSQRD